MPKAQPEFGSNQLVEFQVRGMDIAEPGLKSQYVIERNTPFEVKITFEFKGPWAPWLVSTVLAMDVKVTAESLGPGDDYVLGTATVQTQAGKLTYNVTMPVNPASVTPNPPLAVGAYKVVGLVTAAGAPPPPIAGYDEVDILQIV